MPNDDSGVEAKFSGSRGLPKGSQAFAFVNHSIFRFAQDGFGKVPPGEVSKKFSLEKLRQIGELGKWLCAIAGDERE